MFEDVVDKDPCDLGKTAQSLVVGQWQNTIKNTEPLACGGESLSLSASSEAALTTGKTKKNICLQNIVQLHFTCQTPVPVDHQ